MGLLYERPQYIDVSEDIKSLKNYIQELDNFGGKNQKGHINMAFDLLVHVLWGLYDHTKYSVLVRRSDNVNEGKLFSDQCKEVTTKFGWTHGTKKIIFGCMKNIMRETGVSPSFINRISLTTIVTRDMYDIRSMIPTSYSKFENDSKVIKKIIEWRDTLLIKSKNRSPVSLKHIISFFCLDILPKLSIDLEINECTTIPPLDKQVVKKIVGSGHGVNRKLGWFKLFVLYCVEGYVYDANLFKKHHYVDNLKITPKADNRDPHRISVTELEKLHQVSICKGRVRNELIFMLLITTGIRVGGLVNILLNDICTINGSDLQIKTSSKTIEKGNKWFSFSLTPHIKHLLHSWIKHERVCNGSDYLFPARCGGSGHISTGTVRSLFTKLKKLSGCEGSHIHVHSVRHSFAHILLENGNSIEVVSKLMGHSSVATTQSYYLKENAVEVAQRANIPWLGKQEKQRITPSFLLPPAPPPQKRRDASRLMVMPPTSGTPIVE
jgi:site-specific recombinase XerD